MDTIPSSFSWIETPNIHGIGEGKQDGKEYFPGMCNSWQYGPATPHDLLRVEICKVRVAVTKHQPFLWTAGFWSRLRSKCWVGGLRRCLMDERRGEAFYDFLGGFLCVKLV